MRTIKGKGGTTVFIFCFLFILASPVSAQTKEPGFTKISVSGYMRSFVTFRNLSDNYVIGGAYTPKVFIINGVYPDHPLGNGLHTGYREPLLMLELKGKPTANTSFNIDYLIDNQMTGQLFNDNSPNFYPKRIQSYRYLNLGGSINTEHGKFDLTTGGILFLGMSPFTLWNFEYRDDMFERYPWEWQTNSMRRYESFYNDKNIARDSRWGNASFQGIVFTGSGMPFRTGMKLAYGKSNNSGAFQSYLANNNKYILCSQIIKKIGSHQLGFNYYGVKGFIYDTSFVTDYTNVERQNIITSELKLNLPAISIFTEAGMGSLHNPIDSIRKWDPALNVSALISKEVLPFPVSLQYYMIGPNVVNLNSGILNSSNRNIQGEFGGDQIYNTNIFEGVVTEFGQLTNNRQAINLSTGIDKKDLKFVIALSAQQEIENKYNLITYQHRLNALNRSQFIFYRAGLGPYGRQMNQWRRSWEKLSVTDSITDYKKGFNLIDFSVKYKTVFLGRPLIISNYINYNSVQDRFSPIAVFTSKAFLRSYYHEFMVFYNFLPKITFVGLLGTERNFGNLRTDLAENGKPIDQTGYGYGVGLDIDLSATAGLYLRQKWYSFSDKNFILDKFKGYDMNVELKIFF
jgi:hypothetical protein